MRPPMSGANRASPRSGPRLLGRGDERRAIDRAIEHARGGRGATLVLLGEAGIGKTALLDHAAERGRDLCRLHASPLESERKLPHAALADLVRPLAHRLSALPDPQEQALRSAVALGPPAPGARYAVAAAALNLLAAEAGRQPLLLLIDDAQWLDDASAETLEFALHRLGDAAIAAIIAARIDDIGPIDLPGAQSIQLAGLGTEHALELLRGCVGPQLDEDRGRTLVAQTAGNPLALKEAGSILSEDQLAGDEPLPQAVPTGALLERYFARAAEGLPEDTRRALVIAAADDSRDAGVVHAALAEIGLDAGALDAAEVRGIVLRTDGALDFRHPLVRATVYRQASTAHRRTAHRALAAALAGRREYALRAALHMAAATSAADEAVAGALESAALTARARGGPQASLGAYERAAHLTPDPRDRARRLLEAGRDAVAIGSSDRSARLLRRALEEAGDEQPLRAEIQVLLGRCDVLAGHPQQAHEVMTAEAAHIADRHPQAAAALLLESAVVSMVTGDTERLVADASRAGSLTGGDSPVGAVAQLVVAEGLLAAGRASEGWPMIEARLPQLREPALWLEMPELVGMAGQAATWIERFDVARDLLVRMVAAAREAGALRALVYPLAALSQVHHRAGSWPRALADASEAVELARAVGAKSLLAFALTSLARIDATVGRSDAATRALDEAVTIARRLGLGAIEQHAAAAKGLLQLGASRFEDAVVTLTALRRRDELEFRVGPAVLMWHADLVEALVRAHRPDDAVPIVEDLEARSERGYGRWGAAAAARCRGLLARDRFEEHFQEALNRHDDGPGTPFERARTELCFGERLRRAGRRIEARQRLHSAFAELERLGAEPWAERARGALRASGERLRGPAESPAELTPQELRVAVLVAEGASNNEAAAALFLSPKTVEFHLSRVYRKLGIRSRAELARTLPD